MISIEGYKTFHGDLIVKPVNGNEPFTLTGDWLYKPNCDCWYGGGQSFPADICEVVELTAADTVPVVRCGDCRHETSEKPWRDHWNALWCERHEIRCQADDFCKQGECRTPQSEETDRHIKMMEEGRRQKE